MHALALVVIPPDGDPTEHVTKLLAPFNEEDNAVSTGEGDDEEWTSTGWWDWWQIGGRYTGALDDSYDPSLDPDNIERCDLCDGTGTRDWSGTDCTPEWIAECGGCNGCKGIGQRVKWATGWKKHDGDVQPLPVALAHAIKTQAEGICFTLVAGETVLHRQNVNPAWKQGDGFDNYFLTDTDFDKRVVKTLTNVDPTYRVAVVDYHC